ncbi:DUF262 domain-containing protein [Sorangium sp. So ce448]|uniref:DUF262 domain-containing protein n=1 Tax=Sorangium sp. So ce448 TaxID=3133314 RepID=UPI003F60F9B9
MPFYERQPYIQALHQIVKEVMRGDIRIPRFQRPGTLTTWRPEQRGDLLDSLYRGFPVGTILLWSTTTAIPTHDVVGGFRVPRLQDPRGVRRLLLDGHQRLSTLVQILGPGLVADLASEGAQVGTAPPDSDEPAGAAERWVFDLDAEDKSDNSRERFVLLKSDQQPKPTQVPLNIVLDRTTLNRWIRGGLMADPQRLNEEQSLEADRLRDRLREYSMPVAVLAADSLKEATESFKRINSSGTPMSDFHMVAALAFDERHDPQQQFAEARAEYLAPIGWTGVSDTDVLRVAAGIDEKKNPAQIEVAELADRLRKDRGLIERAFQAVAGATQLLRRCGVLGPESLPYTWQLITLAVHLGRASAHEAPSSFDEAFAPAAERWFWLTTYGEVFAGVNSAVVDRSLSALSDMLGGKPWTRMERDVSRQVRPLDGFDFRTARSKACALSMARIQDAWRLDGPAHQALTKGVESMQLLLPRGKRSRFWHLTIVTPEQSVSQIRDALRRRDRGENPEPGDRELLERLGVEANDTGSLEDLLIIRRDRLLGVERSFVENLGLSWAQIG